MLHRSGRAAFVLGALTLATAPASAQVVTQIAAFPTVWYPRFPVADAAGNVYIPNGVLDNFVKIALDGTTTVVVGPAGDGLGHVVDAPISVDVDAAGNVYAGSQLSSNVLKITPGGAVSLVIDASGDGAGNILNSPIGLHVDDATGNVYAGSQGYDANIFRITPGGTITQILDASGDGVHGLILPRGIATDSAGNVFVAGGQTDNVFKVTPGGTITQIFDVTAGGLGTCYVPRGLVVDSADNLYVACAGSSQVYRITPGGAVSIVLGPSGDGVHGFPGSDTQGSASEAAMDGADNLFVAAGFAAVFRVTAANQITWSDVPGASNLTGMAADDLDNAYVVDPSRNLAFRVSFGFVPTTTSTTTLPTVTSTSTSTTTSTLPGCLIHGCRKPTIELKGRFNVKNNVMDGGDSLAWKWTKGEATTLGDIGDPLATTSYTLCVIDALHDRYFAATVPPGGTCGDAPCWKDLGAAGFKFADKSGQHGGIQKLVFKPGIDGAAIVLVRGKGENLAMPHLPMAPRVRVQLQASNGTCWAADFLQEGVLKAGFGQFAAKASIPAASSSGAFLDAAPGE